MQNIQAAQRLEEVASILEQQRANPFRVRAYRQAAATVRRLPVPLIQLWREGGDAALRELPGVGDRLALALRMLATTGRLPMLERLRGMIDPVAILASVPGVGRTLAGRLHRDLGIDTLEDLEAAAHDGRLKDIAGIGAKKIAGIIDTLSARLGRTPGIREPETSPPPVAELLDVDREYRGKAAQGALPTIAPRRFNAAKESWLPVLHTERADRHYTALFSNTARAHELGKTHDWVVIYCDRGRNEHQFTVVTAPQGLLAAKRVVRGREDECAEFYSYRHASIGSG
jgi:DNA polymerase (family X)